MIGLRGCRGGLAPCVRVVGALEGGYSTGSSTTLTARSPPPTGSACHESDPSRSGLWCDTEHMATRPFLDERELPRLAQLAAPLQARPESHVVYLGIEAEGILAEIAETTWRDVGVVAVADDADEPIGWLIGDIDREMGRVWWFGPFVTVDGWEDVASELLAAGRLQLPPDVVEEEIAVDARFERCRAWAQRKGFEESEGSFVLDLAGSIDPPTVDVRDVTDDDHVALAALHDALFPGTHTTGAALAAGHDETHRRLVIDADGELAGYIAVERQADGSGYIDFLGVAPTARRRGFGAELVRAGVLELHSLGATTISLTVRVSSDGARELYTSLGFREERTAIPLRHGWSAG